MSSYVTQLHYIQGVLRNTLLTTCFIHTPYSLPVHFLLSPEYPALQAHAYELIPRSGPGTDIVVKSLNPT